MISGEIVVAAAFTDCILPLSRPLIGIQALARPAVKHSQSGKTEKGRQLPDEVTSHFFSLPKES